MLTIKIDENADLALNEMGIKEYDGVLVMTIRDSGELLGLGTMRLFDGFASVDGIYIKEEYKSFDLEYGLGKSMLNYMDLHGAQFVVSSNENLNKLLAALKFKPLDECENTEHITGDWKYCLNLNGYFTSNC